MTLRTFSCSQCNESFEVHLPEETKKAGYKKNCEEKDTTFHNLEHVVQCQNCDHRNTVYYCIDAHPLAAMGD